MILTEYDEERHIAYEKDLSRKEGMELGMELTTILFNNNRQKDALRAIKDEEYRKALLREYNLLDADKI